MEVEFKEIELNLREIDLRGWETHVSDLLVDSYVKGIEMRDVFPSVPVVQISQNLYDLYRGCIDPNNLGGHHRAVAHFIANRPLKCEVVSQHDWPDSGVRISIRDILLYADSEERMAERRKVDPQIR